MDESPKKPCLSLTQEWGYTANAHQGVRGGTAKFLTARLSSTEIARHDASEAARARASRLPRALPASDHGEVTRRRPLPQSGACGDSPFDGRRRRTQSGASHTCQDAPIAAEITASGGGGNNIKKTSKEISMPSNAEELRDRLRIWGASWVFAASRFPSKPVLGDDYADYVNGPRVRRSEAKEAQSRVVARPANLVNQEKPFSAA